MDDLKGEPALGISVSAQYAAGRTVVFQTHVDQAISKEDLAAIVDKLNAVADRDEAYYAQEQARRQVEVEENALNNMMARLNEVDAKYQEQAAANPRRNGRISESEVRERKQAVDSIEMGKKRLAIAKDFLAELVKKAGNRDVTSSPADR
jgi:hypothetical protein